MSLDAEFRYPGSSTPRQTVTVTPAGVTADSSAFDAAVEMLGDPVVYTVAGRDVEFFLIGQLASALGRSAVTLRRWESEGIIPKSGYTKPSKDPRGRRRLYSRQQCEGIIGIAIEEGMTGPGIRIKDTEFTAKVVSMFRELKSK